MSILVYLTIIHNALDLRGEQNSGLIISVEWKGNEDFVRKRESFSLSFDELLRKDSRRNKKINLKHFFFSLTKMQHSNGKPSLALIDSEENRKPKQDIQKYIESLSRSRTNKKAKTKNEIRSENVCKIFHNSLRK